MGHALSRRLVWPRLLWLAQMIGVVGLALVWTRLQMTGYAGDAHDYWAADLPRSYEIGWNVRGGFVYSPAFWQLTAPLRVLPWEAFYAAWTGLLIVALAWLVTPIGALLALALHPVYEEVATGNIHILMAGGLVLLPRMPLVYPLFALTKVTPGLLVLWYATRREWRHVAVAFGATLFTVVISVVFAPDLWVTWIGTLADAPNAPRLLQLVTVPLPVRLLLAALLVVVAARTNRQWVLAMGLLISLPSIWVASLSVLLAIPRLLGASDTGREVRRRVGVAHQPQHGQLGVSVGDGGGPHLPR